MKIQRLPIDGLLLIEPQVFGDNRGYFLESYRSEVLEAYGFNDVFVQENESLSQRNVIRGLHLQSPPYAQDKLVRVVKGAIYDVAVDLRKSSKTYGNWYAQELNESNKISFLIPKGFAHGFYCYSDNTIVQYRCSEYYNAEAEFGIIWNDPTLNIQWPLGETPIISDKDSKLPLLESIDSPFD